MTMCRCATLITESYLTVSQAWVFYRFLDAITDVLMCSVPCADLLPERAIVSHLKSVLSSWIVTVRQWISGCDQNGGLLPGIEFRPRGGCLVLAGSSAVASLFHVTASLFAVTKELISRVEVFLFEDGNDELCCLRLIVARAHLAEQLGCVVSSIEDPDLSFSWVGEHMSLFEERVRYRGSYAALLQRPSFARLFTAMTGFRLAVNQIRR